ncbi:DinB family protein [Paraflavitalea pollutisoli]|uniref:DinB family protein n=1 Tax=Paraflavitalea pollutisoli TaxID=3034143 RepID=UPI0023EE21C3|nr:DinB family protein [Paraflavitalea sp. H1-2-19X]
MDGKQLCQVYLAEMKAESTATRNCLERIPESTYKFKPHEKSMEMGYLTLLVADIPRWIEKMIEKSVIDFTTDERFPLSTTDKLLGWYDKHLEGAYNALANITDESLNKQFELKNGGQLLWASPKLEAIENTINHWIHHRGQLTVYMRMNDIAVPSIYGPSGDTKGF